VQPKIDLSFSLPFLIVLDGQKHGHGLSAAAGFI
jgi:hypothetical protein